MAMTTVDVVTNATPSSETIKNATTVVNCYRTGVFNALDATYQKSITYNAMEATYTSRFDDLGYYNSVDGGNS